MSATTQAIVIGSVYILVGLGVFYWSGSAAERTLYDRYKVEFAGVALHLDDKDAGESFYSAVLDFPLLRTAPIRTGAEPGVRLPGGEQLVFLPPAAAGVPPKNRAAVLLVVRNGFHKLHQELVARSGAPPAALGTEAAPATPPGRISEIYGKQELRFEAADPQGNRIVFVKAQRRLPL